MKNKTLPCPFCGGEIKIAEIENNDGAIAECEACDMVIKDFHINSLIHKINNRPKEERLESQIKTLREELDNAIEKLENLNGL